MDDLLPHYERELAFLRDHSADFAKRYPKIAGRLQLTGDVGEDPHVERLIESFALLASRVHKRLDDDFPLFTESLLEVLYPHYLRPFPSCAIACLSLGSTSHQMSTVQRIDRHTSLRSRPVRGVPCTFRTAYDVDLAPVSIASVRYSSVVQAPSGSNLPRAASSALSVELRLLSAQAQWGTLGLDKLRVYLDGEASQVSALRDCLLGNVVGVQVQTHEYRPWLPLKGALPQVVGFGDDEALIDPEPRGQAAYRHLTEYFAFPDKYNFLDLPLPAQSLAGASQTITLHFLMGDIRSDSDVSALLETVTDKTLRLFCTPVVNLFEQRADPIRWTRREQSAPVLPDARRAFGYEVYAVDKVYRVRQDKQGEHIDEFLPFYSLQHAELVTQGEEGRRYWALHCNEEVAQSSPGYEYELSIVDVDFDPAEPQAETLSIEVRATNRNLPNLLAAGSVGGDLFSPGGTIANEIHLLRKPTQSMRFERNKGVLWRLISHLSLNHLSLADSGIEALREMLRLYDLPRSPTNRTLLEGLQGVEYRPATAYLPGKPFPSFVRGTEIRVTVDETCFVGSGLQLFTQVMERFFALYAHINSFTELKLVSARTGEELIACSRQNGRHPLL
jgi:type VI secretion system protein ImpG